MMTVTARIQRRLIVLRDCTHKAVRVVTVKGIFEPLIRGAVMARVRRPWAQFSKWEWPR